MPDLLHFDEHHFIISRNISLRRAGLYPQGLEFRQIPGHMTTLA
jgi:hypothetical protein